MHDRRAGRPPSRRGRSGGSGLSGRGDPGTFRQAPRSWTMLNLPPVLVGVVLLLFAGGVFPGLPVWWRMGAIPVATGVAIAGAVLNVLRPGLVIDGDGVKVVSSWSSRRHAWDGLVGWFVTERGGWCRIALVTRAGPVVVSGLPLDARRDRPGEPAAEVPARLDAAVRALERGFAAGGIRPAAPTPDQLDDARRTTSRLIWTSLALPPCLLAAVILVSFLLDR